VTAAALERAAERREDAAFLAAAAARADAILVPVHAGRVLVAADRVRGLTLPRSALPEAELTFLGLLGGAPCFAVEAAEPLAVAGATWRELRPVLTELPGPDLELLMLARAFVHWHRTHRHCGACGATTVSVRGGHERRCHACGHQSFPRLDPAVIVVVGDDQRVLLGRQASWDAGRYSALAGFVEPGETLEGAVAREVREETGVEIGAPRYAGSQPWPFPSSLMIGFHAEPTSERIALDGTELEDARWFSRADLVAGLTGGSITLSSRRSIAWRLIEQWFDRAGTRLAGVPGA
jgi:NAD+ diphosphatase